MYQSKIALLLPFATLAPATCRAETYGVCYQSSIDKAVKARNEKKQGKEAKQLYKAALEELVATGWPDLDFLVFFARMTDRETFARAIKTVFLSCQILDCDSDKYKDNSPFEYFRDFHVEENEEVSLVFEKGDFGSVTYSNLEIIDRQQWTYDGITLNESEIIEATHFDTLTLRGRSSQELMYDPAFMRTKLAEWMAKKGDNKIIAKVRKSRISQFTVPCLERFSLYESAGEAAEKAEDFNRAFNNYEDVGAVSGVVRVGIILIDHAKERGLSQSIYMERIGAVTKSKAWYSSAWRTALQERNLERAWRCYSLSGEEGKKSKLEKATRDMISKLFEEGEPAAAVELSKLISSQEYQTSVRKAAKKFDN